MNKLKFAVLFMLLTVFTAQAESIVDIQSLAARLEAKEQELKKMEMELADKEKRLKALEEELIAKENELNGIKDTITKRLNEVQSSEDENLNALARIYSSTKPKSAAEIFVKMDTDKAVQLIRRIPPMNAGKIMAALGKIDAEKASQITEKLTPEKVNLGQ
jgi:flagellar motility protein MotE (MotC chaperone)